LNPLERSSVYGLACVAALVAAPSLAAPASAAVAFNIKAGSLEQALVAYSTQSGLQLLYTADLVKGLQAPAVDGPLTPTAALSRLLAGTGLVADYTSRGSIVLRRAPSPGPRMLDPGGRSASPAAVSTADAEVTRPVPSPNSHQVAEVVVTGSHLRGVTESPSEVVVLDSEELARRGYATVAEALGSLPQNFAGVGTPTSLLAGADPLGTNTFASTGVNLRGLGADATLVLVDGRRMAGTGSKGDFADVSSIPMVAVERVEVLMDGASALYGSDAVGGVVNIRLRRNLDGAETRARYGIASGGVAEEMQFAQSIGRTWTSGRALLAYEHYQRDSLPGASRDYAASSDLRRFGGSDHRAIYSAPGNVVRLDPATSSYVPIFAVRPHAGGTASSPADFVAGEVNLQNQRAGVDLLPRDRRDSVYVHADQELGSHLRLDVDARYTKRKFLFQSAPSTAVLTIGPANPNYVRLPGLSSQQIAYSYGADLGPVVSTGVTESVGASAGLTAELASDWQVETYAAFAQEFGQRRYSNMVNSRFVSEALGNIADNPNTIYSPARDGYFNPYGAGQANSAAVLDFIGSGFSQQTSRNRVATLSAQADGSLFQAPGGAAKLALGLQFRHESFDQKNLVFTSTATPGSSRKPRAERQVSAAFAELLIPIFGQDNARRGLHRLDLSLAGRVENYDDVGQTADPKIGLIWRPVEDLNLRASYGTSFRAPTLSEVFDAGSIGASFLPRGAGQTLSVLRYGGNLDLKPESATSWSAGFDLSPSVLPGLKVSATWFDTRFEDRIARPALDHLTTALTDPAYRPFVSIIDPARPADLAQVEALITDPTFAFPGMFPADAYGAIVDARYVNTASTRVSGVDVSGNYVFERQEDRFEISFNATYLSRLEQKLTPASPAIDGRNQPGEPVDFRARASLDWSRGSWSATASANYIDGYSDGLGGSVASWTTYDLQGRWRSPRSTGLAEDLTLSVNLRNLFDRDPPFYDSFQGVGFDAANASPMGRYVSVQLTKAW
jgi:iron complex outermembrane receptor protein